MDYGRVLGRAWEITWRWKVLWILGFLASLGSGGGGNPNVSIPSGGDDFQNWQVTPGEVYPGFEGLPWEQVWPTIAGVGLLICCIFLLIGIAIWVVSVIARGGLIAGVQQVEEQSVTTFRTAWVAGRRKFWTLFGLGILAALPMIVVGLILFALFAAGIAAGVGMMEVEEWMGISAIVLTSIIVIGLLCCGLFLIGIILGQIRTYGERAAIIEDLGWIDAFKRGWQVLKTNLGPTVIFWLLFAALGIVLFVVSLVIILAIVVPIAIAFGLGVAFLEFQTWMILPLICFGLIAFVIAALVRSVITTYISASWTLAYRELTGVSTEEIVEVSSA